jgi:hypothetical protein
VFTPSKLKEEGKGEKQHKSRLVAKAERKQEISQPHYFFINISSSVISSCLKFKVINALGYHLFQNQISSSIDFDSNGLFKL